MKTIAHGNKSYLGVPQGSIWGFLLFDIFICDLFFIITEIDFANYSGDNNPFVSSDTLKDVIVSLESTAEKLCEWYSNN